jgi:hypothetical protein
MFSLAAAILFMLTDLQEYFTRGGGGVDFGFCLLWSSDCHVLDVETIQVYRQLLKI